MHRALVCLCARLEGSADLDKADDLRKHNTKGGTKGTGYIDSNNTKGTYIRMSART